MADLGTVGKITAPVLDGEVLNYKALVGVKALAPDPYPLFYVDFPNQSKPSLETFPGSRVILGF